MESQPANAGLWGVWLVGCGCVYIFRGLDVSLFWPDCEWMVSYCIGGDTGMALDCFCPRGRVTETGKSSLVMLLCLESCVFSGPCIPVEGQAGGERMLLFRNTIGRATVVALGT